METFQTIATVTKKGKLIIPAPRMKAGTRVWVTVTLSAEPEQATQMDADRLALFDQFCGAWKDSDVMSVDEWNQHKHEIWRTPDEVHPG